MITDGDGDMKGSLTRAVEAVSLFTAIGVVISVIIYSIHFNMFGLNYLSIASLSDILRDSIKLLILFLVGLIALIPVNILAVTTFVPRTSGQRVLFAGAVALVYILLLGFLLLATAVISGNRAIEAGIRNIPIGFGYGILILFLLMWGGMYLTVKVYPDHIRYRRFRFRLETTTDKFRFGIILVGWVVMSIIIVSMIMISQMRLGLAMEVEIGDVAHCAHQPYKAVWMGDNKAVLKCEGTDTYLVKTLN